MPTSSWGPATWDLLHTLTEKIKDEEVTVLFIKEFVLIIQKLCKNLPCAYCSKHSTIYFQKNDKKIKNINSKEELKTFLFDFHNDVNKKTKKDLFKKENLEIYSKKNTMQVFSTFYSRWSTSTSGMLNFTKRQQLSVFHNWLLKNKDKFNL